jgi:hypothetical protein
MKTRDLMKIITFYARFTPTYTKIGYYGRRQCHRCSAQPG